MKVIIMACSATKRREPEPLTALERYDGPMWKTLRALLARYPSATQARAAGDLQIWVLSGLYGFIQAHAEVPFYDQRMTEMRLVKMANDPTCDFQRMEPIVRDASAVLFAGGELYRNAMWRASGSRFENIMKVSETDGGGIGEHRAQLGAWFAEHFAAIPHQAWAA